MSYDPDNVFARILRDEAPAWRVYEDDQTLAMLDVMPQSDGHTLVLPKRQARDLFELDDDTAAAVMHTTRRIARGLRDAFTPDGIRLMQFNGPVAGQTVFHFHMHVIPCFADRPPASHGRGMADADLLRRHAEALAAALRALD